MLDRHWADLNVWHAAPTLTTDLVAQLVPIILNGKGDEQKAALVTLGHAFAGELSERQRRLCAMGVVEEAFIVATAGEAEAVPQQKRRKGKKELVA